MARRISPGGNKADAGKSASDGAERAPPSRDDILAFLTANPDRATTRDIAKAFGLKGADRVALKAVLRSLQDDGLLEKQRKRLAPPGALPPVAVLEIFSRDAGGGLIARPVEESEDALPVALVAIRPQKVGKGRAPGIGDRVLARIFPSGDANGPAYSGRIMKVFEKRRETVLGVLRQLREGTWRIEPVERGKPELVVEPDRLGEAKAGDLVEAEPVRQGRFGLPHGSIVNVIGSLASEKAVSMIAIHTHEIPHIFPSAVLEEADAAKHVGLAHREDWRSLPLLTIDPADAKDHDDAVHAEPDPDAKNPGGFIATVAIADVGEYVQPGSPLDREALKRGNSVYFPDRVVPMLPERISNDLCSLREGQDRPALAVRMTFTADGRKLRHSFHRVLIKSAAKLSYQQAQAAIDGEPDDRAGMVLETVLRPLWGAYAALRRGRMAREPLELDLPERKILLNPDGTVDRVVIPPRLDAHRLIEEFMIQANVSAAEALEAKRQSLVYRIHDAPSLAKQESLREFLATLGMSLAQGTQLRSSQINAILARVNGTERQELVNEVVLRSQSQAVYSPQNIGHFGLNLHRYAHFTSPIRRYADLIVHRALIAALGLGPGGLTRDEEERLEEISALISATERRAIAAERETVDRLIAQHLSGRRGETFEARISGVTRSGLFVQLPQFGADGFIPVSTLGDDYYIHDEDGHALVGQRFGKGYQLADPVSVRLVEVAPLAGAMRFEMLSEPHPMPGATRSFHKAGARKAKARRLGHNSGHERAKSRRR